MLPLLIKLSTRCIYKTRNKFSKLNMSEIPTLSEFLQSDKQHFINSSPDLNSTKFFIETYGCQMNTNDSQIVSSILSKAGYYQTFTINDADIVFLNTCSIRANAENKVFQRMSELKQTNKVLGILGCMAERLKQQLFDQGADIIIGPDGYKNLPNLLNEFQETTQSQMDVQLSQTETYDEVIPTPPQGKSAYVSIMRGCNNMCSFCIVPFTRGRERSRNPQTIVEEITNLSTKGVKEITLLGQNVNSYFYQDERVESQHENSSGFQELYKLRQGNGIRFDQLLKIVAEQFPEVRIRFTSPHPKNFPDKVIDIIKKYPNIAKNIHIPIQSGSDLILQKMRRNYNRDAIVKLCTKIRQQIPNCTLSTDVIVGFCDETLDDFEQTLDLMKQIKFENAFMFAYSMREKTHAHRNYIDTVPENEKQRRLNSLIQFQHQIMLNINLQEIGKNHLVLVEQKGKKENQMKGRSDSNKIIVFQDEEHKYQIGDFVKVEILEIGLKTLKGRALERQTMTNFGNNF